MTDAECFRPQGNIIYQTLNHETVIINLENARYYSLNPTASYIWDQLMNHFGVVEIAGAFARGEDSEVNDVMHAVAAFVEELVSEELIAPALVTTQNQLAMDPPEVDFGTPEMEKFTDMEKLIPLDPIHQVGAMGWPFRQEKPDPQ